MVGSEYPAQPSFVLAAHEIQERFVQVASAVQASFNSTPTSRPDANHPVPPSTAALTDAAIADLKSRMIQQVLLCLLIGQQGLAAPGNCVRTCTLSACRRWTSKLAWHVSGRSTSIPCVNYCWTLLPAVLLPLGPLLANPPSRTACLLSQPVTRT